MKTVFVNDKRLTWASFVLKVVGVSFLLVLFPLLISLWQSGDFAVGLLLYILLVIVFFVAGLKDRTVIEMGIDSSSRNLLLHVQHRTRGFKWIEFNADTLKLDIKRIPRRGEPVRAIDISDGTNQWQVRHDDEGIGKEKFEEIVIQLKELYPEAWPPPKKWRRVI